MPIELTLDHNLSEVLDGLDEFRRKQLPFATALALTWTARDAQGELRRQLPRRFTIRNRFLEQGIRIRAATKRNLEASVHTVDELLVPHIEGGRKRPRGRSLALPRDDVRRSKRGIVRRAQRPRAVLNRRRAFIMDPMPDGARGIFERVTKRRYPLRFLYRLHETAAVIKSRFDFYGIATRTAADRFDANFGAAFSRALRSARR